MRPTVTGLAGPDGPTNATQATFTFGCSKPGCAFTCAVDGDAGGAIVAPTACASPYTTPTLADDAYTLTVAATDSAGNESDAVTRAWSIDTALPAIVDLTTPPAATNDTALTFTWTCSKPECAATCTLTGTDAGAIVAATTCSSPYTTPTLDDDAYALVVFATDPVGNVGPPVSRTWTVDTEPPVITGLTGPGPIANTGNFTVDWGCSKPACDYVCSRDHASFVACSPGTHYVSLGPPPQGESSFRIQPTDSVGNVGEIAEWTWIIDTIAPTVTGLLGPDGRTNATEAAFTWGCDEADCAFQCALADAVGPVGQPVACHSGHAVGPLADGDYTLAVTPTDPAGNVGDPASWAWTVDTVPPTVLLSASVDEVTTETAVTYTFTCDDELPCTFSCTGELDDGSGGPPIVTDDVADCTSPRLRTGLASGVHTYTVTTTDAAGNVGSATVTFEVVTPMWKLALERERTCAVRSDGTLWCWGRGGPLPEETDGEPPAHPDPLQQGFDADWEKIATGHVYQCGIRGGRLYCWGTRATSQLGLGLGVTATSPTQVGDHSDWIDVATSSGQVCGLRAGGSLWCWGANWNGEAGQGDDAPSTFHTPQQVGEDTGWASVAVVYDGDQGHTCAVRDGALYCWGGNHSGQLGLGDTDMRRIPVQVGEATDWSKVTVGRGMSCGVQGRPGTLWCWGTNADGRLGLQGTSEVDTPNQVGTSDKWIDVVAGTAHACGLRTDGTLWCWGANERGQLGLGDETSRDTPTPLDIDVHWLHVDLGARHTCASTRDALWCWGDNETGQLGRGVIGLVSLDPVEPLVAPPIADLAAGARAACAIRDDGTMSCWGRTLEAFETAEGELSYRSVTRPRPVSVGDGVLWHQVAVGGSSEPFACAIDDQAQLWCWGDGSHGRLGSGNSQNQESPALVVGDGAWGSVSANNRHACGVQDDGSLWCWGTRSRGRLGLGGSTSGSQTTPAKVGDDADWATVSAGYEHTCALRDDGSPDALGYALWCWGSAGDGRLGNDAVTPDQNTPLRIGEANDWIAVRAGDAHTCGLRAEDPSTGATGHSLWCWGRNSSGVLGVGDWTQRTLPTRVGDDADWIDIALSQYVTCGVRADTSMWCWGSAEYGPFGVWEWNEYHTPRWVRDGITRVEAGESFQLMLDTEDHALVWGSNVDGAYGDGSLWSSVPERVSEP